MTLSYQLQQLIDNNTSIQIFEDCQDFKYHIKLITKRGASIHVSDYKLEECIWSALLRSS